MNIELSNLFHSIRLIDLVYIFIKLFLNSIFLILNKIHKVIQNGEEEI